MSNIHSGSARRKLTARTLFEDPDVHQAATENILKVGAKLLSDSDRTGMYDQVAKHFKNISANIRAQSPESANELDTIELSQTQKSAVIHMLHHLSDSRFQSIGLEVAHAIRGSTSHNQLGLEQDVVDGLRGRFGEVRQLADELLPGLPSMQRQTDGRWRMNFDPEHVTIMKTFNDKWDVKFSLSKPQSGVERRLTSKSFFNFFTTPNPNAAVNVGESTTASPLHKFTLAASIVGAVSEEGRALFDILKFTTRLFGKDDLKFPSWAESFVGGVDFAAELASCELQGVEDSFDRAEMMACPLKLGTQGMDFMHFFLKRFMNTDAGLGTSGVEAAAD